MPMINVNVLQGRSVEQIADLGRRLTETTADVLGIEPTAVRVTVTEVPASGWFVGGESMAELRASGRR